MKYGLSLMAMSFVLVGILWNTSQSPTELGVTPTPEITSSTDDIDLSLLLLGQSTSFMVSAQMYNGITPSPTEHVPRDADLQDEFQSLIDDPDCQLPCWWGMTPGITDEDEVNEILQGTSFYERAWEGPAVLDSENSLRGGGLYLDLVPGVSWAYRGGFTVQDQKLEKMSVTLVEPSLWFESDIVDLDTIVHQNETIPDVHINVPPFDDLIITLIYESEGMFVTYTFDMITPLNRHRLWVYGETLELCPTENPPQRINIELQNPDNDELIGQALYDSTFYESLEALSESTNEAFIEHFRENPEDCFEITLEEPDEDKN